MWPLSASGEAGNKRRDVTRHGCKEVSPQGQISGNPDTNPRVSITGDQETYHLGRRTSMSVVCPPIRLFLWCSLAVVRTPADDL